MKPDAVQYFVCPRCQGDLRLHASTSVEIESGRLECPVCKLDYPIVGGVPRFVGAEAYSDTFGRQWNRWARDQHDSLNGTDIFRTRMMRYTGWTPASMTGKIVVEAGCGPGGFLDVIQDSAKTVIGFDLSSAIDAAYRLHGHQPNVYLAQGDIFHPPIRRGIADRLYTFGVVQHTPDPEGAFRSLIPLVRSGGEIAVWVYRRHLVPQPVYLLRRLTRGLPEPRATRFIEWYVPKALWISGALGKLPIVGPTARRLIPVADYRDVLPLTEQQHREWSLMDTHDALITRYTFPQRWSDIERWTRGLEELRRQAPDEIAAVARVPQSGARSFES